MFVYSAKPTLPHRLLRALCAHSHSTHYNIHPRNEQSDYPAMSEAQARALDTRLARVDSWIVELQLRCANEDRDVDVTREEAPLVRLYQAERSRQAAQPAQAPLPDVVDAAVLAPTAVTTTVTDRASASRIPVWMLCALLVGIFAFIFGP